MNAKTHKIGLSTAFSLLMFFVGNNAMAEPLADAPLFVTTAVEPNIFFTLDDSGSMDWEISIPDTGPFNSYNGVPTFNGAWQAYLNPYWNNYKYYSSSSYNYYDYNIIPPAAYADTSTSTTVRNYWAMYNHNFNTLYYNPYTEYKPWKGVDSNNGAPLYEQALITKVARDPNDKNHTGDTVDLNLRYDYFDSISQWKLLKDIAYIPSYFEWTDDNNDGILQVTEPHKLVEIDPTKELYEYRDKEGNVVVSRSGVEELQNFANWFEYYRKREFATKATIGGVISTAGGSRMGLRVINNGHKNNLRTMTDATNKQNLLNSFYGIDSSGGTPLRRALKYTGDMYATAGTGTYNGETVIVPQSEGGECQQNFTLLMTDGFWNGSSPDVGNTDISYDTTGFDGDQYESNDGGNYEDSYSDTLADVAMKYYETDLRTDLADNVPISEGIDENNRQHMVTYTISFGVKGTLDINTYNPLAENFSWPKPDTDPKKVDDLIHAAYNGRGLYLSAQNPVELESSLAAALADIQERKATQAAVSVTSARLSTDSFVFIAEFNTSGWQGNIFAHPIVKDPNTDVLSLDIPAEPMDALNAAEKLALQAKDGGHASRVIFTKNGKSGVPFKWGNISEDMKKDLRINEGGSVGTDATAQARLNYLRGDTSNEGTGLQFRERAKITPEPTIPLKTVTNVLGDIVHSGPVYVAKPNLLWPDEAPFPTGYTYSKYKEDQSNRPGMIYVGANDGMIHGFSATNLTEKLAYVPSNLASTDTDRGLHFLTHSNYQHRYYNDLTPTVSDIYINGDWHTIGIFGQRAGGRGYSALDLTTPDFLDTTESAASTVMWEFSSSDDADLGYTFSTPQIGLANDGEWVAVFGNGYNNDGSGEAALFIVKIRAGLDGTWDSTDYTKISVGSSTTKPNGLATPALADIDGNGTIDRAYAGDLDGQMWAFDLSSSSPGDWALAHGSTPLFETIGKLPITTQPSLSFHPSMSSDATNAPNIMVAFGSGQYMFDSDKNSTDVNYFYGVWDKGADSAGLSSTNLVEQTYTSTSPRVLTRNSVDYKNKFGWYIKLDIKHERSITDSFIRSGYAFFNTAIPSNDTCLSGAYGYRFIVDLATGGTPSEPVIDITEDGKVDDQDKENDEIPAARILDGGPPTSDTPTEEHIINDEDITAILDAPKRKTGRISWQELLQ